MGFYFDLQYEWMIPMSALAPSLMLTWANQYFSSLLINTGIVLIYVLPLLTAAFPLPTTVTLTFSSLASCSVSASYPSSPSAAAAAAASSADECRLDSDDGMDVRKPSRGPARTGWPKLTPASYGTPSTRPPARQRD